MSYYFTVSVPKSDFDLLNQISFIFRKAYNIKPCGFGTGLYGHIQFDYKCNSIEKTKILKKLAKKLGAELC